jgi:hypothetical protein
LFKDFLAKRNVTTMLHPPQSPDLATAGFYLFTQLKTALKARGFCDATDVIKNATEELKSLSQNGFQECLRNFTADDRSVELHKGTTVMEMMVPFLISHQ